MMRLGPRAQFIPHDGVAKQAPPDLPPVAVPLPSMVRRFQPLARIQATVALSYDIRVELMTSQVRWRRVAWPRQVAMYLARELTRHSFPVIGRRFGNRNHTTVIYAIKAVKGRMAADPIYRADVEALRAALA